MKKKISEIQFKNELYPRDKINDSKVEEYVNYVGVLPAIVINQNNILIDGVHRWHAHKKWFELPSNKNIPKEIECSIIQTKDDDDLFLKAVELNAKHGYQMKTTEKKDNVVKLYKKYMETDDKNKDKLSFDVKRLKETFSIPDSTWSDWTKKYNEEIEGQILKQILLLYLQNKTQENIAKTVLGDKQKHVTILNKIKEIECFFGVLLDNTKSEELTKYEELIRKWCKLLNWKKIPENDEDLPQKFRWMYDEYKEELFNFQPLLYNIWNQQSYDSDNTHFGKFPFTFMENLIYYYTKPFDVVFDPFAGGGITIDVCKKWMRKWFATDLNPIETREDIIKWDINKGLPKDIPSKIDFVFLDPPYWLQAKEKYSKDKEDLANMDLKKFYDSITNLAKELKKKMKYGYVAFVISPTQYSNNDHKFEDHIIEVIKSFTDNGFKEEMRYLLPYSTQQYNGNQVDIMKKEKKPMNLIRDLVVFKRE